jgi:hypothetical protein
VIIYGPSTTTYGSNVTVDNCVFENVNYYAMRFYYMSDITVVDNVVDPVSPPVYAMYSYYWNDIQIERNQLLWYNLRFVFRLCKYLSNGYTKCTFYN